MKVTSTIITLFLLFGCFPNNYTSKYKIGDLYEEYKIQTNSFVFRIQAYYESSQLLTGGLFVYSYNISNSDTWKDIIIFRHDDPIPIPKSQNIRFNENIFYFYIGWIYGVTIDNGKNWQVSDISNIIPKEELTNYGLIQDVYINLDGTGLMILDPIRINILSLSTSNFGINWNQNLQ